MTGKTLDGNKGFVLEIPFLEGASGTKYFVVDKVTDSMMGIYNNKVEEIKAEAQLQPFNLAQLQHVLATLEQRHQGFDASLIANHQENNQIHTKRSMHKAHHKTTDSSI